MQLHLKTTTVIFFIIFSILYPFLLKGQFIPENEIPLTLNGQNLSTPWGGGLNAPLLQMADLNGDGQPEIVTLDRSSQSMMVFSHENNHWIARPELLCLLPAGLTNWFIMEDYDGDGGKDIFTFTSAGIRVFRRTTTADQPAAWELISEGLNYEGSTGPVNLLVNSGDVPAIKDVDGDGDLDILAYDPSGGGGLEYYRNTSVEETGSPGALTFVEESRRWGGLSECECGVFAYNNELCASKDGARQLHAGGKSLLLYDVDGDGDYDLLNGFEECNELYYLENTGTNTAPAFGSYSTFLPGSSEQTNWLYPAAFAFERQEEKGLIISTQSHGHSSAADLNESVWLYMAGQEGEATTYSLQTKAFLQNEMLDVGSEAIPAFIDVDADGDADMLLGSFGSSQPDGFYGGLQLFENTGSTDNPSFQLKNEDYLQLKNLYFQSLHPQVLDFNGDGQQDLLLSATSTESFQRATYLFLNQSTAGAAPQFSIEERQQLPLNLSSLDNPFFFDISGDGLADILSGSFDGSLHYYLNTGTAASPAFELQTKSYLSLGLDNYRRPLIPSVGDVSGNGRPDLLLADGSGELRIITSFLQQSADAVPEPVSLTTCNGQEGYASPLGKKSWPVVTPLKKESKPLLAIGTLGGGILLFQQNGPLAIPSSPEFFEFVVYPNPVNRNQKDVFIRSSIPATIRLLSMQGQLIRQTRASAQEKVALPLKGLAAGFYLVQAESSNGTQSQLLILTD